MAFYMGITGYERPCLYLSRKRKISINKSNKAEEFTLVLIYRLPELPRVLELLSCWTVFLPVPLRSRWNSVTTLAFKGFNVNSNLIENGQDYAVIPLFDDAHKALGRDRYEQINTIAGRSANTSPKILVFTIKFSNPLVWMSFNINKLNVFIFVEGNRNQRKEIHIVGYQPTGWQIPTYWGGKQRR